MEDFFNDREDWFRNFFELTKGIPSYDVLNVALASFYPVAFIEWFTGGKLCFRTRRENVSPFVAKHSEVALGCD